MQPDSTHQITPSERAHQQNEAAITELDTKIAEVHSKFYATARQFGQLALAAMNYRRECGLLLLKRKEATPHGDWQKLFQSAKGRSTSTFVFSFDYSSGQNYMRDAAAHPEPFKTFEEVMQFQKTMCVDAHLLPVPERTAQDAHSINPVSFVIQLAGRFTSSWEKHNGDQFISELSSEGREQLAEQIKPVKEKVLHICNALGC